MSSVALCTAPRPALLPLWRRGWPSAQRATDRRPRHTSPSSVSAARTCTPSPLRWGRSGAVVVEIDRQLLKGHADLVRLADAEVASHQIQFSGRQYFLHQLTQERPPHISVIRPCRVYAAADGSCLIIQSLRGEQRMLLHQQRGRDGWSHFQRRADG